MDSSTIVPARRGVSPLSAEGVSTADAGLAVSTPPVEHVGSELEESPCHNPRETEGAIIHEPREVASAKDSVPVVEPSSAQRVKREIRARTGAAHWVDRAKLLPVIKTKSRSGRECTQVRKMILSVQASRYDHTAGVNIVDIP